MTRREKLIETLEEFAEEVLSEGREEEHKQIVNTIDRCKTASRFFPEARPDAEPEEGERVASMLGAHVYNREDFDNIEEVTHVYFLLLTEVSC